MRKILTAFVIILTAVPAWAQGAGWIGVSVEDQKDRGALVQRIEPNSPAEKAGLKEGDVILEFNKESVVGVQQLTRLVRETPVGRTVDVKVLRNNREETVKVTAERNSGIWDGSFSFNTSNLPDVHILADQFSRNVPRIEMHTVHMQSGIRVEELSDQLRDFFGVTGSNGVLVTSVERGSAAEKAGLKAGDVITTIGTRTIRTPDDFSRGMRADSKPVLKIVRDKAEREIRLD
jgi:serine protease Do